jgi:hypothetical protein
MRRRVLETAAFGNGHESVKAEKVDAHEDSLAQDETKIPVTPIYEVYSLIAKNKPFASF